MTKQTIRTCLHKHMRTSFRQILPQTALKILAGRQPACGFLPCLQQNYARKSAHISYEDRFLYFVSICHMVIPFCQEAFIKKRCRISLKIRHLFDIRYYFLFAANAAAIAVTHTRADAEVLPVLGDVVSASSALSAAGAADSSSAGISYSPKQ